MLFKNYNSPITTAFFIIIFLICINTACISAHAQELTQKEKEQTALLEDLKRQLEEKEQEAKELELKAQEINQSIEETQQQKDSLNKEITLLNSRINKLALDIKKTQNNIATANLSINTLAIQIEEKTYEIEHKLKGIKLTMQEIYETEQDSPIILLLRNESITSMISHIQYLNNLESGLIKSLQELKNLKEILLQEKTKQEQHKISLTKLKNQLTDQQQIEAWQRNQKNKLLTDTKNQESEYRKILININEEKEAIAREIFELEQKIRLTIDPSALPQKQKGILSSPVAQTTITQNYGPTSKTGFVNDSYNFHNGIDFRAPIGTAILAADDGEVIATGNVSPYAYGQWIAIQHNNNLTTLYAHLSVIKVKKGQIVARGDIIAYSGNTGFSTGPHLHFSVYAGNTFQTVSRWFGLLPIGGTVNPLDYL